MFLQYDFDTPPIENGGMLPPLKYRVGVELINDTVWLPKLGYKKLCSCSLILFGMVALETETPCSEEIQAVTWRGHMWVFWLRAPAEVPADSQHQPRDM